MFLPFFVAVVKSSVMLGRSRDGERRRKGDVVESLKMADMECSSVAQDGGFAWLVFFFFSILHVDGCCGGWVRCRLGTLLG